MKRILCLRFPNWPLQRLLAARPELRHQPLVLHQRDARRGEWVAACSTEAARCGVRTGMPLGEAIALAVSPPAIAVRHEPAADQIALEQLAERCEAFSPLVGWETVGSTHDYLLLDVTGIGVLFGGEERLADQLRQACEAQSYRPAIVVAATIGAARALTSDAALLAATNDDSNAKASLVAPRKQVRSSNESRHLVLGESSLAALDPLPIAALRLPGATVDLLAQLGVTRIEQLRQLPRESLAARLGTQVLSRLDQALGTAPETLIPFRPPARFEVAWSLEYATSDRDILSHVIQRLLEKLAATLAKQNAGAVRLECELAVLSSAAITLRVELFRPVAEREYLWKLLSVPLERTALHGLVERVIVRAPLAAPLAERQRALFADAVPEPTEETDRALAELIDRLTLRLGTDAVVRPVSVADAVPERTFRYVPLAGQERTLASRTSTSRVSTLRRVSTARRSDTASLAQDAHQRPLILLSEPHRFVGLRSPSAEPPASFFYRGWRYEVARHWGPERIETGWWRGRTVRRDYYRVEATTGQRFWLFRTGPQGPWFLHGEF